MPLSKAELRKLRKAGWPADDLEELANELGGADDDDDEPEPRGRARNRGRRQEDAEVTILSGATAERFLTKLGFGGSDDDEADGDDGGDGEAGEASEEPTEPEEPEEHEADEKPRAGHPYFRSA